jgi:DNA-directed RNA polymerase subunit alpha
VLQASGGGRVTAADIVCPPEVEIVNPELHIATLDGNDAKLSIELTVEKGKGYVPSDHREGMPIGVIPVDAVYTPIRKVNFFVEHTRVGQVTDYDRLVLEIWTDGTITPNDALSESAEVLAKHLNLLLDLAARPTARSEKQPLAVSSIPSKVYDIPIEDLDLSVRAYNCLKRAGITNGDERRGPAWSAQLRKKIAR